MAVRRWSHARRADAVVTVRMTYDRSPIGEVEVTTAYGYPGGEVRDGGSHRVAVRPRSRRAVPLIWDVVFEEVMRVQQERPGSVTLRLDTKGMGDWQAPVTTLARVIAHELRVRLEIT